MTGVLDPAERTHECRLPAIREFGEPRTEIGVPTVRVVCPEGSRFHCDCGKTYVVVYLRHPHSGRLGLRWRPETRHQRRQRLGLRWWRW